jgi:hypothetical protein
MLAPTHDNDLVPLPHVSRALLAGGFTDQPADYTRLYRGVLSSRIPAELMTSNRWGVRPSNFPKVVEALGLAPSTEPKAKPSRAKRASSVIAA